MKCQFDLAAWRMLRPIAKRLITSLRLKALAALAASLLCVSGTEMVAAAHFRQRIEPILTKYCSDCHADGMNKGGVAFDEFKSDEALVSKHDLWFAVLKNLRLGLMPPEKKPRPSLEERALLEDWIKREAFGIEVGDPDPGRVTVRRLNRVEYRNTIHDLMGFDFNTEVEFPPDDTGYGFDTIGDVLTVSPMLLEKYLAAAKVIVTEAVPIVSRVVNETTIAGRQFRRLDTSAQEKSPGTKAAPGFSYYEPGSAWNTFPVDQAGSYRATLELAVKGTFDYDPGKCRIIFKIDNREVLQKEFGWYDNKTFRFDFNQKWEPGEHRLDFEIQPLTPVEQKLNSLEMRIVSVTLHGPLEPEKWVQPKNYARFFSHEAPKTGAERRLYAEETLKVFTEKAFRRPVDERTVQRLAGLAESIYTQPGQSFEAGVAQAMIAVLASPRFLFRLEESDPTPSPSSFANIDEHALASRLSYFLWSTMPDQELLDLAGRHELRKNLSAEVKRMMADGRSDRMFQNFGGQWLQTRDVEGIAINARAVLARDSGTEKQMRRQQEEFRARLAQRSATTNRVGETNTITGTNTLAGTNTLSGTNGMARGNRPFNRPRFSPPLFELDRDLRDAMLHETEMFFASVVREDRSVTELIKSDYTFLNEKLAKLYGMTNVIGSEMRRVNLPAGSPRGGVLTEGSVLVVTSNPDRTSPVKRGLFVLDNFLGAPAPPPPPNIPALEASEKDIADHEPTLREALAIHRAKPLCASCHARMDPIGLALENFNALGMWREKERSQKIDTAGRLITGEEFGNVQELKRILVTEHRLDFYRCLTEKLLTYAVGRGMEYYDVETIDQIVAQLENQNGRFSALITGVIESAPFQKQRKQATEIYVQSAALSGQKGEASPDAKN